jgi:hypothetical protein
MCSYADLEILEITLHPEQWSTAANVSDYPSLAEHQVIVEHFYKVGSQAAASVPLSSLAALRSLP